MKRSKKYRLGMRDYAKGALIAIGSAVITVAQTSLQAGSLAIDYKLLATVAISATLAYIAKNFFENEV